MLCSVFPIVCNVLITFGFFSSNNFDYTLLESRVFQIQPLYLQEVGLKSEYIQFYLDPTTCGITLGMLLLLDKVNRYPLILIHIVYAYEMLK